MTDKPSAPSSEVEFLPREIPAASPQRDTVLKLLDSEVSLLTQKQKNSGWTSWALVGAISAIAWLLLAQWEAGWPTGEKWLLSYVAITFASYALLALVGVLRGGTAKPGSITRFHLGIQRGSRVTLAFGVAQLTILCMVLFWAKSFSPQTRLVAGTITGLGWLFWTSALCLSFTQIPVVASPSNADVKLMYKAIASFGVLAIILIPALLTGQDLISLAPTALDVKIGVLCAAESFLIRAWLDEANSQPLIDNLLTIRRELALGGMPIEEAAKHIEIEFLGLRVSDVFRGSAQEFIRHAASITSRCKESIARVDDSGLLPPGGGTMLPNPQQLILVQTLLDACQPRFTEVIDALTQLEGKYRRIESRGRFFLRSTGDAKAAMQEILARLIQSHHEAYASYQEFEGRINQLKMVVAASSASNKKGVA